MMSEISWYIMVPSEARRLRDDLSRKLDPDVCAKQNTLLRKESFVRKAVRVQEAVEGLAPARNAPGNP